MSISASCVVVGRKLVKPDLMSPDQPQLFEARIRKSPAAPLIGPHATGDHPRQGALASFRPRPFASGSSIHSCRRSWFDAIKPKACCTRRPKSSSASLSAPSFRIAAIGGISHNEIEDAKPEDLTAGCNVLLKAVLDRANAAPAGQPG